MLNPIEMIINWDSINASKHLIKYIIKILIIIFMILIIKITLIIISLVAVVVVYRNNKKKSEIEIFIILKISLVFNN